MYISLKPRLTFAGSRWFSFKIEGVRLKDNDPHWAWIIDNFHPFWMKAFRPDVTAMISDPSNTDTPVDNDFFWVGMQGNHYGECSAIDFVALSNLNISTS